MSLNLGFLGKDNKDEDVDVYERKQRMNADEIANMYGDE